MVLGEPTAPTAGHSPATIPSPRQTEWPCPFSSVMAGGQKGAGPREARTLEPEEAAVQDSGLE